MLVILAKGASGRRLRVAPRGLPRCAATAGQVSIPPAWHSFAVMPPPLGGRRSCSYLSLRGLNETVKLHAHSMHVIRHLGGVRCRCNVGELGHCIRLLQALLPDLQLRCAEAQRLLCRGLLRLLLLMAAALATWERLRSGGGPLDEQVQCCMVRLRSR